MPISEYAGNALTQAVRPAVTEAAAKVLTQDQAAKAVAAFGQDALKTTPQTPAGMVNHALFFDTNFDHKISYGETVQGLQDIKLGVSKSGGTQLSYVLAGIANLVLGDGVRAPEGSSLWYRFKNLFTVNLDHLMASAKAEAGGKALDPVARVNSQMAFDTGNKGALTLSELGKWIDQVESPGKNNGRTKLGFGQLLQIGADTTKVETVKGVQTTVPAISRGALEDFYKGKLFFDIAARNGHPHPIPPGTNFG